MKNYQLALENGEQITVQAKSYADALLIKDRMDDGERIAPDFELSKSGYVYDGRITSPIPVCLNCGAPQNVECNICNDCPPPTSSGDEAATKCQVCCRRNATTRVFDEGIGQELAVCSACLTFFGEPDLEAIEHQAEKSAHIAAEHGRHR